MKEFTSVSRLMGSAFKLCVVAENEKRANELLRSGINEIKRIEDLLSEFKRDSETSRVNQTAGQETCSN